MNLPSISLVDSAGTTVFTELEQADITTLAENYTDLELSVIDALLSHAMRQVSSARHAQYIADQAAVNK
jgi:hypothetical protein